MRLTATLPKRRPVLMFALLLMIAAGVLHQRIVAAATQGACAAVFTQVPGGSQPAADGWHVRDDGVLNMSLFTVEQQPRITVTIDFYGLAFPASTVTGKDGGGTYSLGAASQFKAFTRTVDLSATTGSCVATTPIIIDSQNGLSSIAGIAGAVLTILGLIGFALTAIGRRGLWKRVAGAFFGLLAGLGAGLLLQEFGTVDPANALLLAAPILGLIIAAACPALIRRGRAVPPAPTATTTAAAPVVPA